MRGTQKCAAIDLTMQSVVRPQIKLFRVLGNATHVRWPGKLLGLPLVVDKHSFQEFRRRSKTMFCRLENKSLDVLLLLAKAADFCDKPNGELVVSLKIVLCFLAHALERLKKLTSSRAALVRPG
jgi:hypothetical protein